jgi:hypothetical protein
MGGAAAFPSQTFRPTLYSHFKRGVKRGTAERALRMLRCVLPLHVCTVPSQARPQCALRTDSRTAV